MMPAQRQIDRQRDRATADDLLGRRIIAVDSCDVYCSQSRQVERVITSITLDNGAFVNFDALDISPIPIVTIGIHRPRRKPRRKCHGCGREIDRYAPTHQVYCGECGKP